MEDVIKKRLKTMLPGLKFNRLTAIEFCYRKDRIYFWKFKCDCGNEKIIRSANVSAGYVISCGCYNKERTRETKCIEPGLSIAKDLFTTYKRNARNRNHNFDLSFDEFRNIIKQNCYICGIEPLQPGRRSVNKRNNNSGGFLYNGIDRLHNHLGYTLENSKACCGICNTAKNNMTYENFINWIKRIVKINGN